MHNKLKIFFNDDDLIQYGNFYKLKSSPTNNGQKGKLILVTSINPTPTGEGKTTTLIGLNDCMNYYNQKSIAALRQPSIGPFLGIKGGATGSGQCEMQNPLLINSGLTGDFFAIETANNLIQSIIENEIYQNSLLNIDPKRIFWNRCLDINDRFLRKISYELTNDVFLSSKFNITAASYLMATFCLAKSKDDFKQKVNNTLVAYSKDNIPIYIRDLNIIDSIMLIMDNALNPNICFSKYDNPILVHGGPFANIAHGCNSIIATQVGLEVADIVFTEAGFGIDLGAEKFLNIKCREMQVVPNLVIIAVTIKSLKYHGGVELKKLDIENLEAIKIGFANLKKNVESITSFNLNFLIVINKFLKDTDGEINTLINLCNENNYDVVVSTMWMDGPVNNKHLYDKVLEKINSHPSINYTYALSDSVVDKANKIAKTIYGAKQVNFSELALKKINDNYETIKEFYVCFAKTFSSLSDDSSKLNLPLNFDINVSDVEINYSAKFVILITSKVFLMPGLPKNPNAKIIKFK